MNSNTAFVSADRESSVLDTRRQTGHTRSEQIDTWVMSRDILVMVQLHRLSGDKRYLAAAGDRATRLMACCRETSSDNYSLYAGRSGVVYALLALYEANSDPLLLDNAIGLIKPANLNFLYSSYVTDNLYDGRAGTLLVLVYLYRISGEEFLLGYIEMFLSVILANASFSKDGLYWADTVDHRASPRTGFALGTAGIAYVLDWVRSHFKELELGVVIDGIDAWSNTLPDHRMQEDEMHEAGAETGWLSLDLHLRFGKRMDFHAHFTQLQIPPGSLLLREGQVKRLLLAKHFAHTIELFDLIFPGSLDPFLLSGGHSGDMPDNFILLVRRKLSDMPELPAYDQLRDAFHFEMAIFEYRENPLHRQGRLRLREMEHHEKIVHFFNNDPATIMDTELSVSPAITIVKSKASETLLTFSNAFGLTCSSLQLDGWMLHCFDRPTNIRSALLKMQDYLSVTGDERMEQLVKHYMCMHAADLSARLHFIAMRKIQGWLYDDVLIMDNRH